VFACNAILLVIHAMVQVQIIVNSADNFIIWTMGFASQNVHKTSTLCRMVFVDVSQIVPLVLQVLQHFVWAVWTHKTYFTTELAWHNVPSTQLYHQVNALIVPRTALNVWIQSHVNNVEMDSWNISLPVTEIVIRFLSSLIKKIIHVFYALRDVTHVTIRYARVACLGT
jgi:hypothetical protein